MSCSVNSCVVREGFSLFRLPKNPALRQKWLQFLESSGKALSEHVEYRICEAHFDPVCVKTNMKRKLLISGSIPSILQNQYFETAEFSELEELRQNFKAISEEYQVLMENLHKLSSKLQAEKMKSRKLIIKLRKIEKYLGKDQLDIINGKKTPKWSNATLKKALMIRSKGGQQLLKYVNKHVVPLPSNATIKRRLSNLKIKPGILDVNLKTLKKDVSTLSEHQKRFVLIYDEKAIVPGVQIDNTTHQLIGYNTLPESKEKAVNAMVFLLTGVAVRFKRVVAVHFMGKTIVAALLHSFIVELIKRVETDVGCFIDALVFDLGPHNISVINKFGLKLTQNSINSVSHPSGDPSRTLFMIPDVTHSLKCIASAFRASKVQIPAEIVEKNELHSSTASIHEVENIFKKQECSDFKSGKGLSQKVLKPDHFEKMNVKIANNLWSNDVICSLDYINETKLIKKKSATSFLLQQFNRWSEIMTKGTFKNIHEFNEVIPFLEEFSILIDSIKFNSRIKHQTGAVWSTSAVINLVKFYFSIGIEEIKLSRFLQDALENIFSQTDAAALKPSALQFLYALRTVTINQGMLHKVVGSSYNYDEEEERGANFLEMIAECRNERDELNETEDLSLHLDFNLPEELDKNDVFRNELTSDAFYCETNDLVNLFVLKLQCLNCRDELVDVTAEKNLLKRVRNDFSAEQTEVASDIFIKLEYIFNKINETSLSSPNLSNFLEKVNSQIAMLHCDQTLELLATDFFKLRLRLMQRRLIHKSNKFSSKSLK